MGMFDYMIVEVPLPDGWEPEPNSLQTKDFDNNLTTVKITADGRILTLDFDLDFVPKEDRPYPDEEGLRGLFGMTRRDNERWRDLDFHGWCTFYGHESYEARKAYKYRKDDVRVDLGGIELPQIIWHHYAAKFTDGNLVTIELVK